MIAANITVLKMLPKWSAAKTLGGYCPDDRGKAVA